MSAQHLRRAAEPRAAEPPLVAMEGIVKRFDRVTALAGVDFDLRPGEIHGLLGENGAGKTTLMNILYGLLQPDAGTISFAGRPVEIRDPNDAIALGVGMVHQHFMLVPTLTVVENVLLSERRAGVVLTRRHVAAVAEELKACAERYGVDVDPSAPVWRLSVGEQQRAEILRALYQKARVLILDEPTATLTPFEAEQLLPRLRAMAAEGTAVVFITHHLDEVITHTDRITVLRGGRVVATLEPRETTTRELARLMVGREVAGFAVGLREAPAARGEARPAAGEAAAPALELVGVEARGPMGNRALQGVDLSVRPGEIVAVAGVEGNGQAELEEVLLGLRPVSAGRVLLGGLDVTGASPAERLQLGLGVIPSDRYRRGLVRALSVADNLVLDRIGERPYGTALRINGQSILETARRLIQRFSIQVSRPEQQAGQLSGGNAQRVVLARTLSRDLRVLVAAQPSRGLDVGAMEFVWGQLAAQREVGVAVLLISADLDEVFALADRCHVLYRGVLVAAWERSEFDRERFGLAMGGVLEEHVESEAAAASGRSLRA
ncbi:MAG TPA: ABC transporter ATP-binding protein [Gaiellaceae bacterium]|nr:ABC transporter ATP-binding protein [Gaiellaceae bacterium]